MSKLYDFEIIGSLVIEGNINNVSINISVEADNIDIAKSKINNNKLISVLDEYEIKKIYIDK